IIFCSIICITSLVSAVVWLLKQEDPLIDLKLFRIPSYAIACFLMFMAGFILYSSTVILPFLVQTQFGYDATTAGLVLSPAALGTLVMMAITGKLSAKVQARFLIPIGFSCIAYGMYYTMQFSPSTDYQTFVYMRLLQVLGLPLVF